MKKSFRKVLSVLLTLSMIFVMAMPVLAEDAVPTLTSAGEEKVIEVLGFNDFHGSLDEQSKNVGYAKLVGYVDAQRLLNPNTLVVSAGDNYNGTALSNLTQGAPVNEMMKLMGVIGSAVGNHEFDWGRELIPTWAEEGGFDFVASNIYEKSTGKPVEWAVPYIITDVDGVKVAFIGLATPETASKSLAASIEGLEFRDPATAAQEWIDFLLEGNAEEGTPDVILALTHLGAFQDGYGEDPALAVTGEVADLCENVTGLDGVITGHTHQTVAGYSNGVPVVQGYYNGRTISNLTVTVGVDGEVTVVPSIKNIYKTKDDIVANPVALANFDKWTAELSPILDEVLGVATAEVGHDRYNYVVSPLGRWTCEVMAEAVGAEIAFQNGGGLRREIPAGDVTVGLLYEVMPYDNTLVTMDLPGADILANVEHGLGNETYGNGSFSGLKVMYDMDKEFGSRVLSITLADGSPLIMDKTYKVVVNNFQATNGDDYKFSNGKNVIDTYIPIRDVLNDAVKANGITPMVADYAMDVDVYTVKAGDVLWKIARQFGTTYQQLGIVNKLKNVNLIYVGDMLYVPAVQ